MGLLQHLISEKQALIVQCSISVTSHLRQNEGFSEVIFMTIVINPVGFHLSSDPTEWNLNKIKKEMKHTDSHVGEISPPCLLLQ